MTQTIRLPVLIEAAGEQARDRFIEFFIADIDNHGTRESLRQNDTTIFELVLAKEHQLDWHQAGRCCGLH